MSLAACGTFSGKTSSEPGSSDSRTATRGGGYYLDDGPGANAPANLDSVPDAVPKVERLHRGTSRPYTVMGRGYTPMTELSPYRARGVATWYGRRYHGRQTSSGEVYDMYAMTAAHTTLPIPSYARVTNVNNGRSVVVRINDRGPFIGDRLIDLSYVAAHRLDLLRSGSGLVEVETILPVSGTATLAGSRQTPLPRVAMDPLPGSATEPIAAVSPAPAAVAPIESIAPVAARPGGLYLQLASFSVQENAQRFMEHVRSQFGDVDIGLGMSSAGNLFRIQSGPYATRVEALEAADRIGRILGATPILASPR
jgi:rare lipoprotein A